MLESLQAKIIGALVIVVLTTGACYKAHLVTVKALKADWEVQKQAAVDAATAAQKEICTENNLATKEESHDLKNKYAVINRGYDSLLKHGCDAARSNAATSSTGGSVRPADPNMPVVQVPIVDAAEAGRANDKQAADLTVLQNFVARIYKANGQANLLPPEYQDK